MNPIIRGWSNYFNIGESYTFRGYVRYALYKLVWNWAHKKHPKWGKRSIAETYFKEPYSSTNLDTSSRPSLAPLLDGDEDKDESILVKRHKWTFVGITKTNSRYSEAQGKGRFLLDPTLVTKTLSARQYSIPNKLLPIHAYHEDVNKLKEHMFKINFQGLGSNEGLKGRLMKKQKGICPLCDNYLFFNSDGSTMLSGNLNIDHIIPLSKNGPKTAISNLRVVHVWCHKDRHNSPDPQ